MYSEHESDFDFDGTLSEPGPRTMTEAELLELERYAEYKCSYRHSVIEPGLMERERQAIRVQGWAEVLEAAIAQESDAAFMLWLEAQPDEEIDLSDLPLDMQDLTLGERRMMVGDPKSEIAPNN